jgi:polysaccharide deacetylase 2 family uncharacterized protein YibQ
VNKGFLSGLFWGVLSFVVGFVGLAVIFPPERPIVEQSAAHENSDVADVALGVTDPAAQMSDDIQVTQQVTAAPTVAGAVDDTADQLPAADTAMDVPAVEADTAMESVDMAVETTITIVAPELAQPAAELSVGAEPAGDAETALIEPPVADETTAAVAQIAADAAAPIPVLQAIEAPPANPVQTMPDVTQSAAADPAPLALDVDAPAPSDMNSPAASGVMVAPETPATDDGGMSLPLFADAASPQPSNLALNLVTAAPSAEISLPQGPTTLAIVAPSDMAAPPRVTVSGASDLPLSPDAPAAMPVATLPELPSEEPVFIPVPVPDLAAQSPAENAVPVAIEPPIPATDDATNDAAQSQFQPAVSILNRAEGSLIDRNGGSTTGFGEIDGVTSNRLPSVGGTSLSAAEIEAAAVQLPAVLRYSVQITNPTGRDLMSIILLDDGVIPDERARLAELPFPITFAIDPLMPDAREAARIYREHGREVLILANAIPTGATPSDLDVTFQSHFNAVPEAVGVLDLPLGGFQSNRALSQQIVPILMVDGQALLTFDRGLNAAAQTAQSEGLANGTVFRVLDEEDENPSTIRRYLDRAVFRATQDGRVIVLGRANNDATIQGLLAWQMEGRANVVLLAPVTATLSDE